MKRVAIYFPGYVGLICFKEWLRLNLKNRHNKRLFGEDLSGRCIDLEDCDTFHPVSMNRLFKLFWFLLCEKINYSEILGNEQLKKYCNKTTGEK